MNCSDCQDLLSEYIDGELNESKGAIVRMHLAACHGCDLIYQDLDQIVQMSKELPILTPQSAAWSRIEKEIQQLSNPSEPKPLRTSRVWSRFWNYRLQLNLSMPQLAGALLLLIMAGTLSYRPQQQPLELATNHSTIVARPLANTMKPEEAELRASIDRLSQTVEKRRSSWHPQMQGLFERNLVIVDRSVAECRQILMRNPNDQIAQEMMIIAYKEKLRLLEQFSTL